MQTNDLLKPALRQNWPAAIIIVLGICAYANSFFGVYFPDDHRLIPNTAPAPICPERKGPTAVAFSYGARDVPADPVNLHLRGAILRQNGYASVTATTTEEATQLLDRIDIAVLDYHLGAGKFGTEVAGKLRKRRPEVPIIIMSATLERRFGGVEDMHLLKGHSSVDDLLSALRSFEARRRGSPVVVDARDFFYSRISLAMGADVLHTWGHLPRCRRRRRRTGRRTARRAAGRGGAGRFRGRAGRAG